MKSTLAFIIAFFSLLPIVMAQPPGDPGGGSDPDVPITGIEVLLGVGGVLGARKLMKRKKSRKV
jgi:hypothetical protein